MNDQKELRKICFQIKKDRNPSVIIWIGTRTTEIIKMDLEGIAPKLERQLGVPIIVARANGLDYAFTQGEDTVLAAMTHRCPEYDCYAMSQERRDAIDNVEEMNAAPAGSNRSNPKGRKLNNQTLVLFGSLPSGVASQSNSLRSYPSNTEIMRSFHMR